MFRKILAGVGLGALAAVLVLGFAASANLADELELTSYDWRMRVAADPAAVNKDIVLVRIDDASIRAMAPTFGRWPWPRLAMSFGYVDGRVAVRVEASHHVADHLRALPVFDVGREVLLPHRVEDAALDRLQAVADIGERARGDDRQRVVQVSRLRRLVQRDAGAIAAGSARRPTAAPAYFRSRHPLADPRVKVRVNLVWPSTPDTLTRNREIENSRTRERLQFIHRSGEARTFSSSRALDFSNSMEREPPYYRNGNIMPPDEGR